MILVLMLVHPTSMCREGHLLSNMTRHKLFLLPVTPPLHKSLR